MNPRSRRPRAGGTKWLAPLVVGLLSGCAGLPAFDRPDDTAGESAAAATDNDPDGDGREGTWPNIRDPGPDMANFPNAAFTIPKHAVHVEFAPFSLLGPDDESPPTYQTQYLLRYGLTDKVELRLFGNGYTALFNSPEGTTGFSPLVFDMKVNLWDPPEERLFVPAMGVEVFVQTEIGSKAFRQGTLPGINLLFDHPLPWDFQFEWNLGINGVQEEFDADGQELNVQWALQRRFFDKLDIFTHGYLNSAALPRIGDGVMVGGGGIYTVNERIAVFGNYSAGVTDEAPTTFSQLGFAVAF